MIVSEMINKTGVRQEGFRLIVADLARRPFPVVAETGCARQADNWQGDGMSTLLWAFAHTNVNVWSFDIDKVAVETCRRLILEAGVPDRVSVQERDGVAGLLDLEHRTRWTHGVSLLYLDSLDVDMQNPREAAQHTLNEFIAGRGMLREGSLVAVDDNMRSSSGARVGKGMYVADFMARAGKPLLHDGYQLVWRW